MRKIYPPSFNRFAGFVLYSLLSIAIITLAQETGKYCEGESLEFSKLQKLETIGYVQPGINITTIKWNFYTFINVIANDLNFVPGISSTLRLNEFVTAKNENNSKTKILLSIRNYDLSRLAAFNTPTAISTIIGVINDNKLDGVDIEHPGKRGGICTSPPPPAADQRRRDDDFARFLRDLRNAMNQPKKTLMLTVGIDILNGNLNGNGGGNNGNGNGGGNNGNGNGGGNNGNGNGGGNNGNGNGGGNNGNGNGGGNNGNGNGGGNNGNGNGGGNNGNNNNGGNNNGGNIFDLVDFLNVETHHYSLYQNLRRVTANPSSFPNAPLYGFQNGINNWLRFGSKKIFMSIDFGNTIQNIPNPGITQNQTVEITDSFEIQGYGSLINICPSDLESDRFRLYSWPWRNLSSVLDSSNSYCGPKLDSVWKRKFEQNDGSSTPWLYQNSSLGFSYYYVSYEDPGSISAKLKLVLDNSLRGISISDVSYDDNDGTLISYIHGNKLQSTSNSNPSNSPNTPNPTSPGSPTDLPDTNKPNPGVIAAGVLGSLVGLLIVVASCVRYRQRSHLQSKDVGAIPKGPIGTHITSKNAEPSPNRFASPTTVIPVASGYVTAMFDFLGKEENDLSFKKGDKIEILERGDGPNDWWVGRVNGAVGEFPGNYVKET